MSDQGERQLGVVEAFVSVRDQCPSGRAQTIAKQALESLRNGEPGVLREQAYFVLAAIRGWRGERAALVHASLRAFIDGNPDSTPETD